MKNSLSLYFFLLLFVFIQMVQAQVLQSTLSISESTVFQQEIRDYDLMKNRVIPIFMITIGLGMAGIWTADIASGKFSEQGNFFSWREGANMLWPHIMAEYLTAAGLITGGLGLYQGKGWAVGVSLFSLGAVTYSAINSSGWVLAEKDRIGYGIPMWVSLAGSAVSLVILLK
jgi:hypothetical protein